MQRLPVKFRDLGSIEALEKHVIAHGSYSQEENLRIFNKWFSRRPHLAFLGAAKKYGITGKRLCDVGCSYGSNLVYCQADSYGVEIEPYPIKFATGIGLNVIKRDVVNDLLSDLPPVEVVWTRDLLEHVDSPHVVLRKLHSLLEPGGLILTMVPTLPPIPAFRHLPFLGTHFQGHLQSDHVNAFTPATLRFTCERAGFETVELTPFYPGPFAVFNKILRPFAGIVFVGRKVDDWDYPKRATRARADNAKGYDFKGQEFPKETATS